MKSKDKNRDPKRAEDRAPTDARCALRKLTPRRGLAVVAEVLSEGTPKGIARERVAAVYEVGLAIGLDLAAQADSLLGRLTAEEIEEFSTCPSTGETFHARLARVLLLTAQADHGSAKGRVETQWGHETYKKAIRSARSIDARRP